MNNYSTLRDGYPFCEEIDAAIKVAHTNIDTQAAMLSGYDQSYEQMGAGQFNGKFLTCHYDDEFTIFIEQVNRELFQRFQVPADEYGLCMMMGDTACTKVNGVSFTAHQALLLGPSTDVVVSTSNSMMICVVSIARSFFESSIMFDAIATPQGDAPTCLWHRDPRASQAILTSLQRSMLRLSNAGRIDSDEAITVAKNDKVAIVSAALALLSSAEVIPANLMCGVAQPGETSLISLISGIGDIAQKRLSVDEFCESKRINRRSLENKFRRYLGTSPAKFANAIRLNRVRRDLQSAQHRALAIGDIAARNGIWHLGRFAGAYNQLFGELPSETRSRLFQSAQ